MTEGLGQNRNYRRLFLASAISNLGDGVSLLAYPWLATLLTRDPLLISLTVMAGRLPWFLFSLPAGVLTDRLDRQRTMVRADLIRMGLALAVLALVMACPALPLPAGGAVWPVLTLSALVFLLGTAEVLRDNAAQTLMPAVVAPGDLERANGRMWSAEQVMNQFAGPPLAGMLIALSVALPFGFDAATFGLAAILVAGMRLPPFVPGPRLSFATELRQGIRWLMGDVLIRRLALVLGLTNMVFAAAQTMLALYAQERLGLGAFGYGLLLTAGAAGGVLAGLAGPAVVARLGQTRTVHLAMAIFGAGYLLMGLVPTSAAVATGLFCDAFGGVLWNVVTVSYRQRTIPPALLGRVNAAYRFVGWGMIPFGALLGGLTVRLAEPVLGRPAALSAPFLIAGLATALLTLWSLSRLRFPDTP